MLRVCCLFMCSLLIQASKGVPTAEEAYNFFTFNFEPDPQEETEKISRKRKKQKKASEGGDEEGGEDDDEQEDAEVDEGNQDEHEDQVKS